MTWSKSGSVQQRIKLVTQNTHKVLIIPMAEPLARHVESLPVSDDSQAPLHPRACESVLGEDSEGVGEPLQTFSF
jgi:hypothetical protein